MASSFHAITAELVLNLEGMGRNRSGASGSNFGVIIPASSPSSTTSSAVVCAVSLPPGDREILKAVRVDTKTISKKQYQKQIQQLFEISGRAIQHERFQLKLQNPQQLNKHLQQRQFEKKKFILPASQGNNAVAAALQQNMYQLLELGQQASATQGSSTATATAQLQQCTHQILQHIQHFQLQANQQEIQLPLAKSSVSSSNPLWEGYSVDIDLDTDTVNITASANDEAVQCQSQGEELVYIQQNMSTAYSNMRIQTSLKPKGATTQGTTGIPLQPMNRKSVSIPCSSSNGLNAQSGNKVPPGGTLFQYQRFQSDPAVAQQAGSVTVREFGLQVVTSKPFASQATSQQISIQSRLMLESVSVPVQSILDSVVSTTPDAAAVAPELALEFNVDTSIVPPPSASEEPKALSAVSSAGTIRTGTSLADIKPNSGKESKVAPIPPQVTSADTIAPDQSMFDSTRSTTPSIAAAAVASETALEYNVNSVPQSPPSAVIVGRSLPDMNENPGKENKLTSIPITSTDSIGLELTQDLLGSAEPELKHADGGAKLKSVEPNNNEPENPPTLLSSSCAPIITEPHPSPDVALTCSAPIPAPHSCQPVTATTKVCQCNKPQLPAQNLDLEADSNRDEALSLACNGGKEELVELLVSKGTDIELRDKKGLTPLMLAATAGHEKIVEVLLNHGANIEAKSDKSKDTALALACLGGRLKVVELLLKRGANKENHNVNDYSPLTLAASGGHIDIIKLLIANGAEINSRTDSKRGLSPLMMAANNGHVAAVRILLEMGSDVNAIIADNGYTALTLACYHGKQEVVKILLENKAYLEQRIKDGHTPLQLSASKGFAEVGRILLDHGADVNASPVPSSRETALTLASDKGLVQLVDMLLKRGAQIDVKNKKGNSALWLAANGGHLQVVELLYKANADIDFKDNRKVSCLMAAFRKGHIQLVDWMVKRVTQFPSDEEIARIIAIADNNLLPKCQLCKELICAAKDRQAAEANKKAAYLLKELDVEKKREDRKRAAAAKKREKKKLKKQDKRRVESGDIDDLQELGNANSNDDTKSDGYTKPVTANPAPTTSYNQKAEDGNSDKTGKKNRKKIGIELPIEDVIPIELQTSKRENCAESEIQLKKTKKSSLPPEPSVKVDDSLQISKSRMKENVSSDKSTAVQYPTRCTNESLSKSTKSLTSSSITNPKKPIEREEEWKEVARRRPLSSQENSGSAAGTIKKNPLIDQASATLSVIHSSERSRMLVVPSNAIGRVIGYGGCNIRVIEEISGAVIDVEKQRKGQNHRTILLMGMPEYISQAQQLILVLVEEPEEEFKKLATKLKAANEAVKASGTDIPTGASTERSKSTTGTTTSLTPEQVLPVSPAVKMDKKTSSPTASPPSSNITSVAPSSQGQPELPPSVSMIVTSVADTSASTSSSNSTSPVQDCFPFNSPFSQVDGTSMSGANEVNAAKAPGYRRNLNASTAQSSLNLSNINEAMPFPTSHVSGPIGNCYLPPTPQLETVPTLGMEEKTSPTSTALLAPGLRMFRNRQPDEHIQQHPPPFDELSVPNLTPQENGPIEPPGQTFSLAPGVGRPQRGRPQQPGLLYPPMFGDDASHPSFTPANFGFNAGMRVRPTDGADVNQLPHHMPVQNFGSDYPVPIGTSYPDMELMVNLYPGPGVMTRTLDPSALQPGLQDFSWYDETTRRVEERHSTDNNIGPWRMTRSGSFRD